MSNSNSTVKKDEVWSVYKRSRPEIHQSKAGTPTMGGMIILASVIVTSLVFMFVEKIPK